MAGNKIRLKRVYDTPERSDGRRVLVDRVWPRGMSKEALRLDGWLKDLAPSTQLRKWFGHDPAKWAGFKDRYFRELDRNPAIVERLVVKSHQGTLTLVFAASDTQHNNAIALKEYLERVMKQAA